jgi:hypothetical protein
MVDTTSTRTAILFYTIELAHLSDGSISISITATTVDEEEPQLLNQEIASTSVPTFDDALAVINEGVMHSSHD